MLHQAFEWPMAGQLIYIGPDLQWLQSWATSHQRMNCVIYNQSMQWVQCCPKRQSAGRAPDCLCTSKEAQNIWHLRPIPALPEDLAIECLAPGGASRHTQLKHMVSFQPKDSPRAGARFKCESMLSFDACSDWKMQDRLFKGVYWKHIAYTFLVET